MKLEYPLNDVLPSIDHARDRLLARIYRYRQDHEASQLTTDEDCTLLYAYSEWFHPRIPIFGEFYGLIYSSHWQSW